MSAGERNQSRIVLMMWLSNTGPSDEADEEGIEAEAEAAEEEDAGDDDDVEEG